MFIRFRRLAFALGGLALGINGGCYAWQPAPAVIPASQRLRIHLTPDGTSELARYLGPRVSVAEGVLSGVAPDGTLMLGVQSVQTSDGVRQAWTGEGDVSFPAQYVNRVEQSLLNRRKSVLAGGLLGAAVVAVAVAALGTAGANGGEGTGTGSPPP